MSALLAGTTDTNHDLVDVVSSTPTRFSTAEQRPSSLCGANKLPKKERRYKRKKTLLSYACFPVCHSSQSSPYKRLGHANTHTHTQARKRPETGKGGRWPHKTTLLRETECLGAKMTTEKKKCLSGTEGKKNKRTKRCPSEKWRERKRDADSESWNPSHTRTHRDEQTLDNNKGRKKKTL